MEQSNFMIKFLQRNTLKRKRKEDEFYEDFELFFPKPRNEEEETAGIVSSGLLECIGEKKRKYPKQCNKDRNDQKLFWSNGYVNWSNNDFKNRLRINRDSFNLILNRISPMILKQPTNMVPNPIEDHRQLALTLYRMAHGCSFTVLKDVFGVSQSLATATFNKVIRVLVYCLYDEFVGLPSSEDEWVNECKSFIENYEFPCIGAWDGFHVHVASHLKNYFSFKNKYTVTSMGLVGYNKRFLHLTTGAPGSTHDARLLRHTSLFRDITNGAGIPNKCINLGEAGEIPLVTIGDSAFPRLQWLVKGYNENTRDEKERYFNKILSSARVVTENAYGMLKGRWRLIYKKCECKLYNVKYVIMAGVLLHNICIHRNDPCKPRWRLDADHLELIDIQTERGESRDSKRLSNETSEKIKEWLWNNQ